ncbi:hypothetical protein N7474_009486 [Penicillium riverlandense]|uniref:uncharacterized protein n=1 Tax=Penicillium riverlandense TaxID=1903569 RepID=UPI0025496D78|nr:uncharacterized protein N7474_009486 [Penicillium riverlandense]KAJ5808217.1 hypothetical protein N7474_009486 [Penicillium riverlandense]
MASNPEILNEEGTMEAGLSTSSTLSQLPHLSSSEQSSIHPNSPNMPFRQKDHNPSRRQEAASDSSSGSALSTFSQGAISSGSSAGSSHSSYPNEEISIPPHATILPSPSFKELEAALQTIKEKLAASDSACSQYLLVLDIDQVLFKRLEEEPDVFRGVRAAIYHYRRKILYKVMPGDQHDQIAGMFDSTVAFCLFQMGLFPHLGHWVNRHSARVRGNFCSKEPDSWLGPYDSVNSVGELWPSLALEIGVSEPSQQLRNDARWWYANSKSANGNETKLVVLIKTTKQPAYRVDIEVWTEVLNPRLGPTTRNQPSFVLDCTQRVQYTNNTVYGAPVILPFHLVMRRPPGPGEHDILLDEQMIRAMCAEVRL